MDRGDYLEPGGLHAPRRDSLRQDEHPSICDCVPRPFLLPRFVEKSSNDHVKTYQHERYAPQGKKERRPFSPSRGLKSLSENQNFPKERKTSPQETEGDHKHVYRGEHHLGIRLANPQGFLI